MILEQCKGVHCVDLGESFQTHIYLQNLASIQPRTSPLKFVEVGTIALIASWLETRTPSSRREAETFNKRKTLQEYFLKGTTLKVFLLLTEKKHCF